MTLLDSMPHRVTIRRFKSVKGEMMATRRVPVVVASAVVAWVQNASMREVEEYQKRDLEISHRVFFNAAPSLRVGDTITVTSGPSHVGDELVYQAHDDRSAGLGVLWRAMCRKENNEPVDWSAT